MSAAPPRAIPLILATGIGLVLALAFAVSPFLALAVAVALAVIGAALQWPDLATYAVLFLLYSNLPAVSVAFHGVPKPVAAAFPLLLLIPLARRFAAGAPIVATPAFALLLLSLALQLAGAAFAREPAVALDSAMTFALEGVVLYLLVVNVVRTKECLQRATWSLVAAGVLMAAAPIVQQATGTFDQPYGGLGQVEEAGFETGEQMEEGGAEVRQARLSGTIGEKNRYAQVMLILVPLALSRCLAARGRIARLVALGCAAAIALGFALAFSRGGAVGIACVLAAMVAMRLVDARKALLVAAVLALVVAAVPQYGKRLVTIGSSIEVLGGDSGGGAADGAVRRRFTSMLAASRVFLDHPILGVGPGMFLSHSQEYGNQDALRRLDTGRRAHSLILEIAAEQGAVGLLLFLGALTATVRALVAARRACSRVDPELADLCAACLLGLVAYLGTGLFLHLSYLRYFALLLGLCGAAAEVARLASPPEATAVPSSRPRVGAFAPGDGVGRAGTR